MNYSTIIREVLDNTNQERNSKNIVTSIKHDIEKTIRDMFTDAEAPIKSETFNLAEYADDAFVDAIIPVVLDVSVDSYTHTETIKSMNGLTIVVNNESETPPAVGTSNLNVTITSSTGEELLNQDISIVDAVITTEVIDILFNDVVGATMVLTGSAFSGGDADEMYITSVAWTKDFTSLELPSYIYVPFGANFRVSTLPSGVAYLSKEMAEEEYNRWVPLGAIKEVDEDSDIFEIDSNPATIVYSFENLEFDNRIGFFFSVVDDKLYLIFKPAVVGTVTIRFSYIPSLDIVEENAVPLHQAFINGVIDGTTIRQLQKMLLKVTDELGLIKIKSAMSLYNTSYKLTVNKFAGYNRKKTEVRSIKMFGIVDDTAMLLQ